MYVVDGNQCKLMEGGMAEKKHAANVYETIRYQRRDPALLEWLDGSTFKMRVFPLEAKQEKRIILSYTQKLPTLHGVTRYRFAGGHNMPLVRDWSFQARVKPGPKLNIWSPSHEQMTWVDDKGDMVGSLSAHNVKPNEDVLLEVQEGEVAVDHDRPRFSSLMHEGNTYLMMRWRPALPSLPERQRRDWIVLFESSGQRDPLLAGTQADILKELLRNAEYDDTFTLVTANSAVRTYNDQPLPARPAQVADALKFLHESTHLVGALDLEQGLQTAVKLAKNVKNPHILHLGSGTPAIGERDAGTLAKLVPDTVRYVGVGVGKRWNRAFMKTAAERTGGLFTQINPDEVIAWRAFDLLATLNTPRLLGIHIAAADERTRFLTETTLISQGEELCAIARLESNKQPFPIKVAVTGRLDGKLVTHDFPVINVFPAAGHLPRTWAKLEIDRLLAEGAAANQAEIVKLSKAMYVMSPFTSLLVLETDADYEKYQVDRGRKDHWATYPCPAKIPLVYEPDGVPPVKKDEKKNAKENQKPSCEEVLKTIENISSSPINELDGLSGLLNGQSDRIRVLGLSHGLGTGTMADYVRGTRTGSLMLGAGINSDNGLVGSIKLNEIDTNKQFFLRDVAKMPALSSRKRKLYEEGAVPLSVLRAAAEVERARQLTERGLFDRQVLREAEGKFAEEAKKMRFTPDIDIPIRNNTFQLDDMPIVSVNSIVVSGSAAGGKNRRGSGRVDELVAVENDFLNALTLSGGTPALDAINEVIVQRENRARARSIGLSFGKGNEPFESARDSKLPFSSLERGRIALGFPVNNISSAAGFASLPSSRVNVILTTKDGQNSRSRIILQNVPVLAADVDVTRDKGDGAPAPIVTFSLKPEEALKLSLAREKGTLSPGLRGPNDGEAAGLVTEEEIINGTSLQYVRPPLNYDRMMFTNLVQYAPGLHNSRADILATLEQEAELVPAKLGSIDLDARKLIERARSADWLALAIPAAGPIPGYSILYNGAGQFACERVLVSGLREQVVCDGKTLRHLYPEIGLAATRPFSRHHQEMVAAFNPAFVAPAEELARGHDVRAIDGTTIALVPFGADAKREQINVRLVFGSDGRLGERQIVLMPSAKLILRQFFAADGALEWRDAKDKVIGKETRTVAPAKAPNLQPDEQNLVVMNMPIRTREHLIAQAKKLGKDHQKDPDIAAQIFISDALTWNFANPSYPYSSIHHFGMFYKAGSERSLGFLTLINAADHAISNSELPRPDGKLLGIDIAKDFPKNPLAKFLIQANWDVTKQNNPELLKDFPGPKDGFLSQLTRFRNMWITWDQQLPIRGTDRKDDPRLPIAKADTLKFLEETSSPVFAYAVLDAMMRKSNTQPTEYMMDVAVKRLAPLSDPLGMGYVFRYEYARSLYPAGKGQEAGKRFTELYAQTLAQGVLPPIDADFRTVLQMPNQEGERPGFIPFARKTLAEFLTKKQYALAFQFAKQMEKLGDEALCDEMLTAILDKAPADERTVVTLASIQVQIGRSKFAQADRLVQKLLEDKKLSQSPALWRWRSDLAQKLGQAGTSVACLERALELEYADLPEMVNLESIRTDYRTLLNHYQKTADALVLLEQEQPKALLAKVIRTADRWRILDADAAEPCQLAGKIFHTLGKSELAWNYWTTPIDLHPAESKPWLDLAQTMEQEGDLGKADRAFVCAFATEPTNPEILWQRAQNLVRQGQTEQARRLYRQIADGQWQERFSATVERARALATP
jgi:tetratricopeptide (TPR) repeat protein